MKDTIMPILFFALFFLLITEQQMHAQNSPLKLGKIDMDILKMEHYPEDTSAGAVILSDFGFNQLKYYEQDGFKLEFQRHVRIKILKKKGYEWADIQVPLYKSQSKEERIITLKGYTYNLVGGKVEKYKISKKDVITEERNQYWNIDKFTMPNVKEGSVIEYQYTIQSEFFFNLNDWQFQYTIPVQRTEYWVKIPEYLIYNKNMRGYVPLTVNDQTTELSSITYANRQRVSTVYETHTTFEYENIDYHTYVYHYVAENLPAIQEEPYMPDIDNYFPKMEFELSYVQFPNSTRKDYTKTWDGINDLLLLSSDFGSQLNRKNYANEMLDAVQAIANPLERTIAIYEFVKKRMKWNGVRSIFVTSSLRDAFQEGSGSSGDLNIMLTALLRAADLDAKPVLVSTRDHGFILPTRPSISQFNYVICLVNVDGKDYLLDATDPFCPVNLLPSRCLNYKGRVIDPDGGDWVSLTPTTSDKKIISISLEIDEEGSMTGNISINRYGYAAYNFRKKIKKEGSQEDYVNRLESDYPGLHVSSFGFENLDNLYSLVKTEYDVTIEDNAEVMGDLIYFSPIFFNRIDDNPFKLEEREYPVDFIYPSETTISFTFNIPEGYAVETLPESTAFKLPENGGLFMYNISQLGNTISIASKIKLRQTWFNKEAYPHLKEFMSLVVAKHAEQIVLKKKP